MAFQLIPPKFIRGNRGGANPLRHEVSLSKQSNSDKPRLQIRIAYDLLSELGCVRPSKNHPRQLIQINCGTEKDFGVVCVRPLGPDTPTTVRRETGIPLSDVPGKGASGVFSLPVELLWNIAVEDTVRVPAWIKEGAIFFEVPKHLLPVRRAVG